MAVEKYLLDEFDSGEREAFEDHFFSCRECAEELRVAAALRDRGKELFARDWMPSVEPVPVLPPAKPAPRDWFAWLRPAYAVPAFALLLLVIGLQNFYEVPELQRSLTAMNAPAVMPSAYLPSGSSRGDEHVVAARPGEIFLLTIDISGTDNSPHVAELYDVAGQKKWSLPIPENAPKSGLSLKMPGNLPAGSYSLVVKNAAGDDSGEVSRYAFTLQRQ